MEHRGYTEDVEVSDRRSQSESDLIIYPPSLIGKEKTTPVDDNSETGSASVIPTAAAESEEGDHDLSSIEDPGYLWCL